MGLFRRQMHSAGLCRLDNCNNSERSSRRFLKTNEAPHQNIGRRTWSATLGHRELSTGHFWLSVLAESISCYIYVFIACATRISWTGSIIGHEPNLIAMSLASGAAMMLLMLIFRTVHVNPALTVAFLLTGRIPLIRALIYILVHCVSSVAAIALLYSISVNGHAGALGLDNPHPLLESWQILLIEFVISFVVTMATYATCSYSSYTNARRFILEQVGQNCTDVFDLKSTTCDNENMANLNEITSNHHNNAATLMNSANIQHQQQKRPTTAAFSSNLATAPRRPMSSTNFRVHPQSKTYMSDTYENSDFEYEYDNHRIYTHQQSSPELAPGTSRVPPIEELMHDESQLLAPNGFAILMTPCQSFIVGLAYAMTSLTGVSILNVKRAQRDLGTF
jgi:glycerol uptake facilitator-like aquaporin